MEHMEHEDIQARLSELRDGELPSAERAEVSRHVESCSACREALGEMALIARVFLPKPAPVSSRETEDFVRRVMARLPSFVERDLVGTLLDALAGRWLAPAMGLACVALLLSFRPYGPRAAEPDAALFVADGREVILAPADQALPAVVLDAADEER